VQDVESSISTKLPPVLRGVASWPWYLHYLRDPLECLAAAQSRFGSLFVLGNPVPIRTGGRRFVLAIGGRYNREVFGQPDVFRPGGQVMVGPKESAHYRIRRGIFAMHGERHRIHRRLMQPPFLKPAVATYAAIMARLIDQVIDRWRPGEPLDMYREMRTLSNWVAANILFGNEDFAASIQIGKEIEQWLTLDARARNNFFWFDVPGTAYRRLLRQAEQLENTMRYAIERNRRTNSPGGVLSILIRAFDSQEAWMTETNLIAHAVILYAASFETTANVLAWMLFLIAQHPLIAAELHDEILQRLDGWPPDDQQLDALPLLNGVVHESLRLMPPVAFTFRTPVHDVELGGFPMHRGDKVILSHYLTHRDSEIFPEPNRFDPTRWFTCRPDPYEYIPFSAGPRLCLGYSFALLELKLTVARVMQRFCVRVLPGSAIDAIIQLTLRPRQGIPMIVHAQDRAFVAAPVTGNIHRMIDLLA
jgi:cytochrome P450